MIEFKVLGSIEAWRRGDQVVIHGDRTRALLGALVLAGGGVVSPDRLIDQLWGDDPPANALNALQRLISRLRRDLGVAEVVVTSPGGYALHADASALDALRFEDLVAEANRLRELDPAAALKLYDEALRLWRGQAYAELVFEDFIRGEITRLEEMRLSAIEDRNEVELRLGRDSELVADLRDLVDEYPLRERLVSQLMRALYRAGRQSDALDVYRAARMVLNNELGLEPGPELRTLEEKILQHDLTLTPGRISPLWNITSISNRVSSFIGRAAELEEVRDLIRNHRLVTVTGPGGAGKTSVALEAARGIASEFDDLVCVIDLSPVEEPSRLAMTVVAALGLKGEDAERGGEDSSLRAEEFLSNKRGLIILDNCEHLVEAAATLVDRLLRACPDLRIVATSREVLGLTGEVVWGAPPLETPPAGTLVEDVSRFDAVRLFVERARSVNPGIEFKPDDFGRIADICRHLDGLPLAIELAAARARALPVAEICARLDDRFRLLTGGGRSAPPRQQTLQSTLDWSYQTLTGEEALLFERLSLFAGPWAPDAAEAVCSDQVLTVADVLPNVLKLVDRSLVTPLGDGRFRLLETIREYARQRLNDRTGAEPVVRRHASYFLSLCDALRENPADAKALDRVEAHRDDIDAALDWAIREREDDVALEFVGALGWFWATFSSQEGLVRIREVLDGKQFSPSLASARAILARAYVESYMPTEASRSCALEAAELLERFGDKSGSARARAIASFIEMMLGGDIEYAMHLADEAMAISEEIGDDWTEALVSLDRFRLRLHCGEMARALREGRDALRRFTELRDPWGMPWTRIWLAVAERTAGHVGAAEDLLGEAALMVQDTWYAACLVELERGTVALLQGEGQSAIDHYGEADRLAAASGVQVLGALVDDAAGFDARLRGDLEEAVTRYSRAIEVFRTLGNDAGEVRSLTGLGLVEIALGAQGYAHENLITAARLASALKRDDVLAPALEGLALLATEDLPEVAARLLGAAGAIRRRTGIRCSAIENEEAREVEAAVRPALGRTKFDAAGKIGSRLGLDKLLEPLAKLAPTAGA